MNQHPLNKMETAFVTFLVNALIVVITYCALITF